MISQVYAHLSPDQAHDAMMNALLSDDEVR
jgi:hypothetical protein